jgi:hypothetical protein
MAVHDNHRKATVAVPPLTRNRFDDDVHGADDASTEDDELDDTSDDDDDDDENNTEDDSLRQESLRKAREALQLKKEEAGTHAEIARKPLSKKEKQALKAKELDDLDLLLNEFGVATGTNDALQDENNASLSKKKKKKSNKDSTVTDDKTDSSMLVHDDTIIKTEPVDGPSTTTLDVAVLDVASLIRAKGNKKIKEKTAADIASATAAKEAKAKKEAAAALEAKKQKKKNKDKYAFGGAPSR